MHSFRWWCDLKKVCEDGQGIICFDSNMKWAVGSGDKVKLWEDVWVDNCQLKVRFSRAFNNSLSIDSPLCCFGK